MRLSQSSCLHLIYQYLLHRTMNPTISVIIPAYNTASYISRAIESALGQTLENIEVIVIDDASTDNTLEVVKSFSDSRLTVIVNEKNMGVSNARNRALKIAQGEWIAVLDSDDWYAADRLEKLLLIAKAENADIVIDDLNLIQQDDTSPWSTLLKESGEEIFDLKPIDPIYFVETGMYGQKGLHLGLSKPIFKRDFLLQHGIEYDGRKQVVEDFHFMLQCLVKEAHLIFVPQAYYFYRSRLGSLVTQSKVRHINQCQSSIQEFLQQNIVQNNKQLTRTLHQSLSVLHKYKTYYSVVEPLKQKKYGKAMVEAMRNPYFFIHFLFELRAILVRRLRYYFLKDKLVYEMVYGKNK